MPIAPDMPVVPVAPPTEAQIQERRDEAARRRHDDAVIHRGEEHIVTFVGTTETGEPRPPEKVKVRLLRVVDYAQFLTLQGRESEMIAFACDRPKGWADDLTPVSHSVLIEAVISLNFSWAIAWQMRQVAMAESLGLSVSTHSPNSVPAAETS